MQMMDICPRCGNELTDGFCPICGYPVEGKRIRVQAVKKTAGKKSGENGEQN